MADHPKWKHGLLSSNMPLELEAAGILASKGFAVHSNYKYDLSDFRLIRDLGVDIHAKTFVSDPTWTETSGNRKTAQLELLVECRHRHSDAAWIFLPDPNPPELSPIIPGNTIRVVDKFSSYIIASDASALFGAEMPLCQKGVEIHIEKGDADEGIFRQGLSQLQYALPRILTENILFYIETRPEDNIPFLFCPVFLTNSELFVLNRNAGLKEIENASGIRDIAAQVPCLVMYLRYSPDFESQCRNEASRLQDLRRSGNAMIVERRRAAYYESRFNLPFTVIDALMAADRYYLDVFFTQFIVCSSSHFHILADRIRDTVLSAVSSQRTLE